MRLQLRAKQYILLIQYIGHYRGMKLWPLQMCGSISVQMLLRTKVYNIYIVHMFLVT